MTWIKIRSFHAVRTPTRMFNTYITRCGRTAIGHTVDDLPLGEKSCETCTRLIAREADRAGA